MVSIAHRNSPSKKMYEKRHPIIKDQKPCLLLINIIYFDFWCILTHLRVPTKDVNSEICNFQIISQLSVFDKIYHVHFSLSLISDYILFYLIE